MNKITPAQHLKHMTDGFWHDDCEFCLTRRRIGGTGVPEPGEIRRQGLRWEVFDGLGWQLAPPPAGDSR